jgi:sulfide dehydrogenase cytochrome subunit
LRKTSVFLIPGSSCKKKVALLGAYLLGVIPILTVEAGPSADALALTCNGCHGPDGISYGDSIPSIAGQDARYLLLTLQRYKEGERKATIMDRIARGYPIYDLRKIATYFAGKPWEGNPLTGGAHNTSRGEAIHREHCEECHEDSGWYQDKDIPRLAGQGAAYLYLQLMDYAKGDPAMPQPSKMAERLEGVSEEDLWELSQFYRQAPPRVAAEAK